MKRRDKNITNHYLENNY